MTSRSRTWRMLVLVVLAGGLGGCRSSLAPAYGEKVTSVWTTANEPYSVALEWTQFPDPNQFYSVFGAADPRVSPSNFDDLPYGFHTAGVFSGVSLGLYPGVSYHLIVTAEYPTRGFGPPAGPIEIVVPGRGYDGFPAPLDPPRWYTDGVISGQTPIGFGAHVVGLGDINGDGTPEIAVAAPTYSGAQGRVYVGPIDTGTADGDGWTDFGEQTGDQCAVSLAAANVLGDSNIDLLVGCLATAPTMGGSVRVHPGNGTEIDSNEAWVFEPGDIEGTGTSVAAIGDLNADGRPEFVAVSPAGGTGRLSYFESLEMPPGQNPVTTGTWDYDEPAANQMTSVASVRGAGDALRPHYLLGEVGYAAGAGRVRLVTEGAEPQEPPVGWWYSPEVAGSGLGEPGTFAAADFNGDGHPDVALGLPRWADPSGSGGGDEGSIRIFLSDSSGNLSLQPSVVFVGPAQRFYGARLAAGDVNGDGFADLLLGSPDAVDSSGQALGHAALLYGSGGGLLWPPIWERWGQHSGSRFGAGLDLFDLDGDGSADMIVGTPAFYGGNGEVGAAETWMGPPATGPDVRIGEIETNGLEVNIPTGIAVGVDGIRDIQCALDWGDGGGPVLCSEQAHTYREPGRYVVRVRVEDSFGLVSSAETMITVTE